MNSQDYASALRQFEESLTNGGSSGDGAGYQQHDGASYYGGGDNNGRINIDDSNDDNNNNYSDPCSYSYDPAASCGGGVADYDAYGGTTTGGLDGTSYYTYGNQQQQYQQSHHSLLVSVAQLAAGNGTSNSCYGSTTPTSPALAPTTTTTTTTTPAQQYLVNIQPHQQQMEAAAAAAAAAYGTSTGGGSTTYSPAFGSTSASTSHHHHYNSQQQQHGSSSSQSGHKRISSLDQFLLSNPGLLAGMDPTPVLTTSSEYTSTSTGGGGGGLLSASADAALSSQQQRLEDEVWLSEMTMKISGLSLEPMTGMDVLRRVRTKLDDVIHCYLPCVDFLVQCQQELRRGLQHAQQQQQSHHHRSRRGHHHHGLSPRQFYASYVQPLPQRFQLKNQFTMPSESFAKAYDGLVKLQLDSKKVERHGSEAIKNQFLGGMKEGQSWGLRKWLSQNGNALQICTDVECVVAACRQLDKSDTKTSQFAAILRPLAQQTLNALLHQVPKSYQEHSSAHPYLPFFHRLESALKGMANFDPNDDGVVVLDDSDDDDDEPEPVISKPPPIPTTRKRQRGGVTASVAAAAAAAATTTTRAAPAAAAAAATAAATTPAVAPVPRRQPQQEEIVIDSTDDEAEADDNVKENDDDDDELEDENDNVAGKESGSSIDNGGDDDDDDDDDGDEESSEREFEEQQRPAKRHARTPLEVDDDDDDDDESYRDEDYEAEEEAESKKPPPAATAPVAAAVRAPPATGPTLRASTYNNTTNYDDGSSSGESDEEDVIEIVGVSKPKGTSASSTGTSPIGLDVFGAAAADDMDWKCPSCFEMNDANGGDTCRHCGETNFMKDLQGQLDWFDQLVNGGSSSGGGKGSNGSSSNSSIVGGAPPLPADASKPKSKKKGAASRSASVAVVQWPLKLNNPGDAYANAKSMAHHLDRLAHLFDQGRQSAVRPASAPCGTFWEGRRYAAALRLFVDILRSRESPHFVNRVSDDELIGHGQPPFSHVVKHPISFSDIVKALIRTDGDAYDGDSDSDYEEHFPKGVDGRLRIRGLDSWNMWKGMDLLQAIDLVLLNSLAYGKQVESPRGNKKKKSQHRSVTNRLRKNLWEGITTIVVENIDDSERRKFYTPTRRSESSGFVVYKIRER